MSLTPEQSQTVAEWVAAGDNLSAIQKKLAEHFKLSMTFMDVRFLVDDLNLALKDPAPKQDANDVTKTPPRPAPAAAPGKEKTPPPPSGDEGNPLAEDDVEPADADAFPDEPAGASNVTVSVDKLNLIPGAIASGTVTFSDGVTGKWIVDHQGRPGFTEISQPGYRPNPTDAQAFMQQLSAALQKQGY